MASIKREKVEKINAECKNDFKFDLMCFLMHNENQLKKKIQINDNTYVIASLYFRRDIATDKNVIVLHLSEYTNDVSYGLGKFIEITEPIYNRKSIKELQKMTEKIDNEMILDLYKENIDQLRNKFIM